MTLTSYEAGLTAFGEDAAEAQGMSTILRLLFLGGASTVVAVAVDGEDYAGAHFSSAGRSPEGRPSRSTWCIFSSAPSQPEAPSPAGQ